MPALTEQGTSPRQLATPWPIKLLVLPTLALFSFGCQTSYLAYDLKLLAIRQGEASNQQAGVVHGQDCVVRVMGFGPAGGPSPALYDLQAKQKNIKYLTQVRIWQRYDWYGVWDHSCWHIRGVGYE